MHRFNDIASDDLKSIHFTIIEMDNDLTKIMKKLGNTERYGFLHSQVTTMQEWILQELGERTLKDNGSNSS